MSGTRWLDNDEQRTWRAFLSASTLLFSQLEREMQRDSGLSHPYYEILVRLSEAEGRALRMSELARNSMSSRSRLSHAVARLEEAGLVRRESCPSDRRGSVAVLTEKGFATLEAAAPMHVEGVRTHVFDQLSREQQHELRTACDAIAKHLSGLAEDTKNDSRQETGAPTC
jgi:DNA-binding MarR family transcriptional regulator